MKRDLNKLLGFSIMSKNGKNGNITDFLIDEETWRVAYAVADLGSLFSSKKVLIAHTFFDEIDINSRTFNIMLTAEDIQNAPGILEDMPVSKIYEENLHKYFEKKI
jgi:hypothetical protein